MTEALWRGLIVTVTVAHLRGVAVTRVQQKQINIHVKEKKEVNALLGGKNIVDIPLMRKTKVYNSLSLFYCLLFFIDFTDEYDAGACIGSMIMILAFYV